ncbi:MAG: hypothetical protein ACP5O5_07715 [Fervidicoccaceae archaeon]
MSEGREQELKEILEALKDTLAELKTTLGDISGPFSSIKREIPVEKKETGEGKSEGGSVSVAMEKGKTEETIDLEKQRKERSSSEENLGKIVRALKIFYNLREQIPGEIIDDELAIIKMLGVSEEKYLEVLKQLNVLVDKSVKSGIGLQDQLISLYIISKLLGISDEDLEHEFLESVLERMRKKDGKTQ